MSAFPNGNDDNNGPNGNDDNNGHGTGDRAAYYAKWDKLAQDTVDEVEAEDKRLKKESDAKLGLNTNAPVSASEKADLNKRSQLKEAKKKWDGVESDREKQKVFLENLTGVTKTINVKDDLQERRVLMIRNSKDVVFNLPVDLDPHLIIKVFIENCEGCTFNMGTTIVSQYLEIAHCTNVDIHLNCPIATVQVDLSEDVRLSYGQNVFRPKDRVYHSAVKQLSVSVGGNSQRAGLQETGVMDDFVLGTSSDSNKPADENQFVTQLDNTFILRTDLVLRDAGNHPTTAREVEQRKRELMNAMREKGVDPNSAMGKKMLSAEDAMDTMRSAKTNKNRGNELFKENDYGQAIIYYSQAIVALEADVGRTHGEQKRKQEEDDNDQLKEANALILSCYSNRAACALKLGQHENALDDATKCVEMDANHVKGLFRKGLSLHALGRYQEACPALGKAMQLDPKNKQINTALQFAERKLAMQARGR